MSSLRGGLPKKNKLNIKKNIVHRFVHLILFCGFFSLENPLNVTKINVKCEKGAH